MAITTFSPQSEHTYAEAAANLHVGEPYVTSQDKE